MPYFSLQQIRSALVAFADQNQEQLLTREECRSAIATLEAEQPLLRKGDCTDPDIAQRLIVAANNPVIAKLMRREERQQKRYQLDLKIGDSLAGPLLAVMGLFLGVGGLFAIPFVPLIAVPLTIASIYGSYRGFSAAVASRYLRPNYLKKTTAKIERAVDDSFASVGMETQRIELMIAARKHAELKSQLETYQQQENNCAHGLRRISDYLDHAEANGLESFDLPENWLATPDRSLERIERQYKNHIEAQAKARLDGCLASHSAAYREICSNQPASIGLPMMGAEGQQSVPTTVSSPFRPTQG